MLRRLLGQAGGVGERLLPPLSASSRSVAQARVTEEIEHRPWPLPERPWLMGQSWEDLLFAHWALAPEVLAPFVPAALPLDSFDGSAWIGVTPFEVTGLRLRGIPPLPLVSRFPEVNVRTYVTVDGKPGIYFLSLDARSWGGVLAARRAYRLPYFKARMSIERRGDTIAYRSRRVSSDGPPAALELEYRSDGDLHHAAPGALDHFLTERYCLYTVDDQRRVLRADIHHRPWPLQRARADWKLNDMTSAYGLDLPDDPPLLHFARRQDVVIWTLEPVPT